MKAIQSSPDIFWPGTVCKGHRLTTFKKRSHTIIYTSWRFLGHCVVQDFGFNTIITKKRNSFSFHSHTMLRSKSTIKMPTKAFSDLQSSDIFAKEIQIWKTLVNLESCEVPPASPSTPLKRARRFIIKGYPSLECHQSVAFQHIHLCAWISNCSEISTVAGITGWVNNGTAAFLNSFSFALHFCWCNLDPRCSVQVSGFYLA